jgi:hypothetical protein
MPKDEFDFDDPMELNGVGLGCADDTTATMTECFVEEFMRLGHDHRQILALFRNPHYIGMNLALRSRGEAFVRDVIGEVFARRGKPATWPAAANELDATAAEAVGAPVPRTNS